MDKKLFGYDSEGNENRGYKKGLAKIVVTTIEGDLIHMPVADWEYVSFMDKLVKAAGEMSREVGE